MASLVLRLTKRIQAVPIGRQALWARKYSSASGLLIEDPKYAFLKELDLESDNIGAFYGHWEATGEVSFKLV